MLLSDGHTYEIQVCERHIDFQRPAQGCSPILTNGIPCRICTPSLALCQECREFASSTEIVLAIEGLRNC